MGNLEIVKYLVAEGASVQAKDDEGLQPLHYASRWGNLEIVKYLVGKGASLQAKDMDGLQPLHIAIEKGNLDIVKSLISTGKVSKKMGSEAINMALRAGKAKIVEYLTSQGYNTED